VLSCLVIGCIRDCDGAFMYQDRARLEMCFTPDCDRDESYFPNLLICVCNLVMYSYLDHDDTIYALGSVGISCAFLLGIRDSICVVA
jgi:hypothetical protein